MIDDLTAKPVGENLYLQQRVRELERRTPGCVECETKKASERIAIELNEREACARAICRDCRNWRRAVFSVDLGWHHPTVSSGTAPCDAAAIRTGFASEAPLAGNL